MRTMPIMEQFSTTNVVKLRTHLDTYMVADDDKETVRQSPDGSSRSAKWLIERVEGKTNVIRLKSCFGMYLTATADVPFSPGLMAGEKVVQTRPENPPNPKVDWEMIPEGAQVKLKNWRGELLQANDGMPFLDNFIAGDRLKSQKLTVKPKKPWFGTPCLPRLRPLGLPVGRANRRSLATAAQPNSPVKSSSGGGSSSFDNGVCMQPGSPVH